MQKQISISFEKNLYLYKDIYIKLLKIIPNDICKFGMLTKMLTYYVFYTNDFFQTKINWAL